MFCISGYKIYLTFAIQFIWAKMNAKPFRIILISTNKSNLSLPKQEAVEKKNNPRKPEYIVWNKVKQ